MTTDYFPVNINFDVISHALTSGIHTSRDQAQDFVLFIRIRTLPHDDFPIEICPHAPNTCCHQNQHPYHDRNRPEWKYYAPVYWAVE